MSRHARFRGTKAGRLGLAMIRTKFPEKAVRGIDADAFRVRFRSSWAVSTTRSVASTTSLTMHVAGCSPTNAITQGLNREKWCFT